MIILRDYQQNGIERVRAAMRDGNRRVILLSPTGSGKTAMATWLMSRAAEMGKRSIYFAGSRELIQQASDHLEEFGLPRGDDGHGIYMSGFDQNLKAPVQVASVDTVHSRRISRDQLRADLLVYDECRLSAAKTRMAILDRYPFAHHIGLDATPARSDDKLGQVWDCIVKVANYSDLIPQWLVPTRVFAPSLPDLKGAKTSGGEYVQNDDLAERVSTKQIVGDVLKFWDLHCRNRQTVGFAVNLEHSRAMAKMFRSHGVRSEHIDGSTPNSFRDDVVEQFKAGRIQVVWNYGVVATGVDLPGASCAINCRPTKRLTWWRQAMNRIQRPAPDKTDAIVVDHTGSVFLHGHPDEDLEWTLTKTLKEIQVDRAKEWCRPKDRNQMVCPKCGRYRETGNQCPQCGHWHRGRSRMAAMVPGSLSEIPRNKYRRKNQPPGQELYEECLGIAAHRNGTIKMARAIYKHKVGEYPDTLMPQPNPDEWDVPIRKLWPGFARGRKRSQVAAKG